MTPEQIIALYYALAIPRKAHLPSTVAKSTGMPKANVERFIALVKTLPCFKYEVSGSGRLKNLYITPQAEGFGGRVWLRGAMKTVFYRNGTEVARFLSAEDREANQYEPGFKAEIEAANLVWIPETGRIKAIAPFLAKKYAELGQPA